MKQVVCAGIRRHVVGGGITLQHLKAPRPSVLLPGKEPIGITGRTSVPRADDLMVGSQPQGEPLDDLPGGGSYSTGPRSANSLTAGHAGSEAAPERQSKPMSMVALSQPRFFPNVLQVVHRPCENAWALQRLCQAPSPMVVTPGGNNT
jgi:hypothetical protein